MDVIESDAPGERGRVEGRWLVKKEGDIIRGGANVWAQI